MEQLRDLALGHLSAKRIADDRPALGLQVAQQRVGHVETGSGYGKCPGHG